MYYDNINLKSHVKLSHDADKPPLRTWRRRYNRPHQTSMSSPFASILVEPDVVTSFTSGICVICRIHLHKLRCFLLETHVTIWCLCRCDEFVAIEEVDISQVAIWIQWIHEEWLL